MTFSQWLFGGIENPFKAGQWGALHIATLVVCTALIVGFYFLVKHSRNPEKARKCIVISLASAIAFFEIMIRFVYCVKLYYFHQPEMNGVTLLWIILPKPWCAVSCWALIACLFVKSRFSITMPVYRRCCARSFSLFIPALAITMSICCLKTGIPF